MITGLCSKTGGCERDLETASRGLTLSSMRPTIYDLLASAQAAKLSVGGEHDPHF